MTTKRILFFLIPLCLALTLLTGISAFAADNTAYFGDTLIFGSDTTHNVEADSQSSIKNLTTMRAGEYVDEKYTVRRLASKTGVISFDMAVSGSDVVLEFEEVHNKNEDSYGYYISVDGTDVYLRVGAETSVGPQHFFVQVPEELVAGKSTIRVSLRNVSGAPVSLTRVWAHSNLDQLRGDEEIDARMPVMILNGDFFHLNWNNYKGTKEQYKEQIQSYIEVFGDGSDYETFTPGYVIGVPYMRMPDERVYELIDAAIEISRELNVPMAINFNSWWDGSPQYVTDGEGGFFTDLKYQQLIYAPNNYNGRGNYQTTTPNNWSNNPWLSMNNDHYNSVRLAKYRQFSKYMSQKLTESKLIAGEEGIPEFSIFIENEPQYWTLFLFQTNEIREVADSSQQFVDAMLKNYGVEFDPTDWLDEEEQEALFYNLNDYAADTMQAAADGALTDYIVVHGDEMTLPDDQLMDNYYTHQFDTNIEKRVISEWDTYETAITKNGNLGMEGYGLTGNVANRNMGAHAAARGKFAAVNIECGGDGTAITPLSSYYAAGANYGVLYNTTKAAQPLLAEMDKTVQTDPYAEVFEGEEIFRYDVEEDSTFEPDGNLVAAEGLSITPMHRNYCATAADTAAGGTLTFRVDNHGKPFENGLAVMVYGYTWTYMDPNCGVEVYAGTDLENMKPVSSMYSYSMDIGGVPYDISDCIDKSQSVAYFQIRIKGAGSGLCRVRALEKYGDTLGHTNGFSYTLAETRLNNLIVTYRADVEQMLAEQKPYCSDHPDYIEAEQLYQQGKYKSAKELLLGTASVNRMPAKYMVIDNGKLGDFPITVDVADSETPVSVILREVGDTVRFELGAETNTEVTLQFSDMQGRYSLTQEDDVYVLSKDGSGEYIESDGIVTLNLTAGRPMKEYPKQFTGFLNGPPEWKNNDDVLIAFHDPELGNYSWGAFFKLADDAEILRGPVEASCDELQPYPRDKVKDLEWGERADVTLNDAGEISRLELRYGLVHGTITKYEDAKFPEMTAPYMEVTEEGTGKVWKFRIDSLTSFESSKTGGAVNFLAASPGAGLGFKEGNIISVYYLPLKADDEECYYAGKIFEEYITVVDEDLNDATYSESVYSENNVKIAPLDGNNLDTIGLTGIGSTGSVVWKVESDQPIKEVAVNYSGRAIMGSTVRIKASANGYIYDEISDLQEIFSHNVNQVFTCYTDDPGIVGGNVVYIKAEFDENSEDTWGFLNSMQIQIKV